MKFSHPLARSAKVWHSRMLDGSDQSILTVVTTLELDKEHRKYKPEHIERLEAAARDYLTENADTASGFLLMNKPKS